MIDRPVSIVIFGASGDLTKRKLIPALFNAYCKGRMPHRFNIVGVSRSPFSHQEFRDKLFQGLAEFAASICDPDKWAEFSQHVWYVPGDTHNPTAYLELDEFLKEQENGAGQRLYYLSTAPSLYEPTILNLGMANMMEEIPGLWRRVIIEKPFGYDLASAKALNQVVHSVLDEHQVYRIDHYLGKETAQNILFLRFANTIFEAIWNRNYVDNVQITVAETVDVGHRADYYDNSGVVRDMFQNHLFALLALVAQEPPIAFDADSVRDEKAKIFRAIRPIELKNTVRAQYADYLQAPGVKEGSQTPTYAALKLYIDNWRWQGVPFYLRSGKAMTRKTSEIVVQFKEPPARLFGMSEESNNLHPNALAICIQPNEGIHLSFETKIPDSMQDTRSAKMDFRYANYFGDSSLPDAYERLLLDGIKGDASLFTRSDAIEESWRIIDPVIHGWENDPHAPPMVTYQRGTWGPMEADVMLGIDGRRWILEC